MSTNYTEELGKDVAASAPHTDEQIWPVVSNPLLWPLLFAVTATEATTSFLKFAATSPPAEEQSVTGEGESPWASPNQVTVELASMQLRDFCTSSEAAGPATLICAPYALHCATIADFAHDHSIVEALRRGGRDRVYVTDWRSATPDMRYFSIDTYLADLNVVVDELGQPLDLVGLCQGGWLALIYAARFPHKVRKLVLVAAPVDIGPGASRLSRLAAEIPMDVFEEMVRTGGGLVHGQNSREFWSKIMGIQEVDRVLQDVSRTPEASSRSPLERRFRDWDFATVDLPGTYYLQVVRWLFKENRIAAGRFVALGREVDLGRIRGPLLLLAAADDELIDPEQLFATARLVGTPRSDVELISEPCRHLALFLGARTVAGQWSRIAHWLGQEGAQAAAA
jgi:poly(3-hydroxyalkanoate) synthetase